MKLLFLGSPGVGKGTYAQVLTEIFGIPHISTGDLLREEAKKNTVLGKEISEIMQRGELVPDDKMIAMLKGRISEDDCDKGFILDGFPRVMSQAEELKRLVKIDHVLNFKADDKVIIERLSGRITCRKCGTIFHKTGNPPAKEGICDKCGGELYQRADDQPESIKNRLEVYRQKTKPLIDYYNKEKLLVEIVINKPINEIREKVISKIQDYIDGKTKKIGEIK